MYGVSDWVDLSMEVGMVLVSVFGFWHRGVLVYEVAYATFLWGYTWFHHMFLFYHLGLTMGVFCGLKVGL